MRNVHDYVAPSREEGLRDFDSSALTNMAELSSQRVGRETLATCVQEAQYLRHARHPVNSIDCSQALRLPSPAVT